MIGVGIDAVEIDRFRLALQRTPRLSERLFSDAERAYAARRNDPTERLAARFAAKEAVMKAMGVGLWKFNFRDVEVVRGTARRTRREAGREGGRPRCRTGDHRVEAVADAHGAHCAGDRDRARSQTASNTRRSCGVASRAQAGLVGKATQRVDRGHDDALPVGVAEVEQDAEVAALDALDDLGGDSSQLCGGVV